jgi:hypothetical protein
MDGSGLGCSQPQFWHAMPWGRPPQQTKISRSVVRSLSLSGADRLDEKLVAKEHDLSFATGMRSEQSNEPSTEKFDEVDHRGNSTALLPLCQPGSVFR